MVDLLVHFDRELGTAFAEGMETAYCGILNSGLSHSQINVKTLKDYLGVKDSGRTITDTIDAKTINSTAGVIWMPYDRDPHIVPWFERLRQEGYPGVLVTIYDSHPSPYVTEATRHSDASFHQLDLPGLEAFLLQEFPPKQPDVKFPDDPDFWRAWRAAVEVNPTLASALLAIASYR